MSYVIATISGLYLGKQTLPYDVQHDLTDVYFVDELPRAHHYDTEDEALNRLDQLSTVLSDGICYICPVAKNYKMTDFGCDTSTNLGGDTNVTKSGNEPSDS